MLEALQTAIMRRENSMDKILQEFSKDLPPLVTRQELERLTGGLIKARTLANLDCNGKGPLQKIRIGKKVVYGRDAVLKWLLSRMED